MKKVYGVVSIILIVIALLIVGALWLYQLGFLSGTNFNGTWFPNRTVLGMMYLLVGILLVLALVVLIVGVAMRDKSSEKQISSSKDGAGDQKSNSDFTPVPNSSQPAGMNYQNQGFYPQQQQMPYPQNNVPIGYGSQDVYAPAPING